MRKRHLRILVICGVILAVLGGVYFIGSGFNVREDVVLIDYAAPPDESEMTITVGWRALLDTPEHIRTCRIIQK